MDDTTFPKVNMAAVAAALGAMICLVFAPAEAIESARYALTLCAELIVPSLLPFFTASALLIRLQVPAMLGRMLAPLSEKLWGVSGIGASAFLAGICGGYPLGAQTVAEMAAEKQLTKEEAERLLAFCNNSGPSFCVGVIGCGVFGSRKAGIVYMRSISSPRFWLGRSFAAKPAPPNRSGKTPRPLFPPRSSVRSASLFQPCSRSADLSSAFVFLPGCWNRSVFSVPLQKRSPVRSARMNG